MKKRITNRVDCKSKKALLIAQKVILDGGIIVYPTDTLYGFGVDARNKRAIARLNEIKRRRSPMSVIMHDKNMVLSFIDIPQKHHYKINKYICTNTFRGALAGTH